MEIFISKKDKWPWDNIDEKGKFENPQTPLQERDRIEEFKNWDMEYVKFNKQDFFDLLDKLEARNINYIDLKIWRNIKPKYKVNGYKLKYSPYDTLGNSSVERWIAQVPVTLNEIYTGGQWSGPYETVMMPAGTFLLLCKPLPQFKWRTFERLRVQVKIQYDYEKKNRRKKELFLELVCKDGQVVLHEGRHRAVAFAYLMHEKGKTWQEAFEKKVKVRVHGTFGDYIFAQEGTFTYSLKNKKKKKKKKKKKS